MLCESCMRNVINKLRSDDVVLLEYLANTQANTPQCSVSKERIRQDTKLSAHHCYTGLLRLECLGFIENQNWSRANKYYITKSGQEVLRLCNDIIGGAQNA